MARQRRLKLNPGHELAVNPSLSDINRFLAFVDDKNPTGCWVWTGCCDNNGYGQFRYRGVTIGAHRFSHAVFNGVVQATYHVNHEPPPKCVGRGCVRPSHVNQKTHSENSKEGRRRYLRNQRRLARVNRVNGDDVNGCIGTPMMTASEAEESFRQELERRDDIPF